MAEGNQHKYLKKIGLIKLSRMGYFVAYPEVYADYDSGVLDVVGVKKITWPKPKIETCGIEVKISRADYFGRKQRFLNARTVQGFAKEAGLGANHRYFLTPPGLIRVGEDLYGKNELYEGWGLMEFDGKKIKIVVKAPYKEVDNLTTMYYMAKAPLYHFHTKVTKLMAGYDWVNYSDIDPTETDLLTNP